MKTLESISFYFELIFRFGKIYLIIYMLIIITGYIILTKTNILNKCHFLSNNFDLTILIIANIFINLLPSIIYDIKKSFFYYSGTYDFSVGIITSSLSIFIGPFFIIILKIILKIFNKKQNL